MKGAAIFCLLAALCTVNGIPTTTNESNDLEILRIQVRNTKWAIDNIIRQLQRIRKETGEDTMFKVTKKWWDQTDSHREYIDISLDMLNTAVNAAKAAGKDAAKMDGCYDTAVNGIKTSNDVANTAGSTCKKTAEMSITKNLGFIDNLVLTGLTLTTELDGIFMRCFDSDNSHMHSCVVAELGKIKSDLKNLETDATSAETTVLPVSNNIILQASNCMRNAYSSIYGQITGIMLKANECIKSEKNSKFSNFENNDKPEESDLEESKQSS